MNINLFIEYFLSSKMFYSSIKFYKKNIFNKLQIMMIISVFTFLNKNKTENISNSKMSLHTYSSQQMKKQINKIVTSRQNIEKGRDISGSMVSLNQSMNRLNPLLKKQESYIKNFFSQQEHTDTQSKDSETRRYANRIFQITSNQINELLNVGEDYFTLEFKNSWDKIRSQFFKQLTNERKDVEQKNVMEFLFRINNIKDFLVMNFMKSFLYRKCLLWKDLNIINEGHVHSQKKETTKMIEDYLSNRGYAPTKPIFQWPGFDLKGSWNMNKLEEPDFSLSTFLKIINGQMEEVFSVVRNYANLTPQQRQHEDIKRNTNVIASFREEIQSLHTIKYQMQQKYRDAVLKDEKNQSHELRQRLNESEEMLKQKQAELQKLKFEFNDGASQINSLREKNKELETDLNRLNNVELKKLKDIEMVQNTLSEEFARIYKNINNFGKMFEFQSDGKKSLSRQIQNEQKKFYEAVDLLGKQKRKTMELNKEITRLNHVILELGEKYRELEEKKQWKESSDDY